LIAEELSTALTDLSRQFELVYRANLSIILNENKLSATGLLDPTSVKELGKIAGVDAIIIGSVSMLGKSVRINVRAISAETAKIIAAQAVSFRADQSTTETFSHDVQEIDDPSSTDKKPKPTAKSKYLNAILESANLTPATGEGMGGLLSFTVSVRNTTPGTIMLNLTNRISYVSRNGIVCKPTGSTSNWSPRPTNFGNYDERYSVELAPGQTEVMFFDRLRCTGAEITGQGRLTLQLAGLVGGQVRKFDLKLDNPNFGIR
jgi:hypothetical protein